MNQEFRTFITMLETATSRIRHDYFQLPVCDADAMYRERVYCYELYHQLRCLFDELADEFPFSLGGEVDKTGHPLFRDGPYPRAKPDLLVHEPGSMSRNLAVVEVKPATPSRADIGHDLGKLESFCDRAQYFRGVFLVYGGAGEPDELAGRVRAAADARSTDLARLTCLYHRRAGEPARCVL